MQKLLKQLNKEFNSQLLKQHPYQKQLDELHTFMKEQQVEWLEEHEFSCFLNEIRYHSLQNKKLFEDTFLAVYVSMFDFWKDLDYQERKHQVNVDIQAIMKEMKFVRFHEENIYLPIFDERTNRIYREEMVLFDLKQYGKIRTDFKDIMVPYDYYGDALYQSDFCSCRYIATYERGSALYCDKVNRLYLVEQGKCVDTISLDPKCYDQVDDGKLQILVSCYVKQDKLSLMEFLCEQQLVNEKYMKKLNKQITKYKKKQK